MMKHVEECYVLSKPCRYDLFKHMSASENFAIDLDSLILHAMMNANVQLQGIQVLHVCFNVESYLHNFRARGAHFQLVVFESNKWIWNRFPQLALTRVAILAHIAKCGHSIIRFTNWWDTNSSSFKQHCVKSGVEFILFSDSEQLPMSLILLGESETIMQEISSLIRTCALFFVSSCATSVVFTTRLIFRDSGAVGFVWNRVPDNFSNELFDTELKHIRTMSSTRLQELSSDQQIAPVGDDKNLTSFRMCAAAAAAQDLLTRKGTPNIEHVKLFLLHIGLLEVLTLEQRCFKGEISSDAESLAFVDDICASMALYIYQEEKKEESLMDGTVTDCFDGRLLLKLIELKNKNKWPSFTSKIKEVTIHLWRSVPALLGSQEWDFPEGGACVEECSPFDIEDADISPAVDMDSSPIAAWLPRSSTISTVLDKHYLPFYENIAINRVNFFKRVHDDAATLGEKPYPLVSDHDITMIGNRSHVKGTERNIMIGNTMERVKQDITKRKDRTENIRKEFNLKPFHHSLKAMMDLITECQSAARHYREEINRIHRTTKENKDKGHKDHWTTSNPGKSDDKNSESELPPDILSLMQVTNFSYLDVIMDSYLYLLQEIMQRWASEVEKATAAGRKRNLHQATSAFLIIHKARGVLEESAHFITPEESKKIKKWLRDLRDTLSVLGLRDNVRVWEEYWKSLNLSLPTPSLFIPEKPIYSVGMTSIRFQMTAMGDRLERATSVPDRRLPFTPDLWQKKLADIIDARQSAVVCTPTSAGKTFASLYCIKTTLMEDPVPEEPGIVVYVAPTKSLLRQALASIYTQFINKKYESTWNVYGVLEDYAFMIERCQALVTIPQAFELLMLSERLEHQRLIQRVRYVIFDEIHSIDDLQTGCIWERLLILIRAPFIALSATVGNPEALIDWTQSVQDIALQQFLADPSIPESTKTLDSSLSRFKVNRIPDVGEKIHRWSDLQKHIYCPLHNAEKFDGRTKVYNENGMLDADYCSDSLLSIHPMSILNLKWLQKEGFPQDFPFLPHEMLTFYDVMKRHVRKKVMPDAYHAVHESLDPEKYFSAKNRPILTQSLVRAFEADLIHEFMKWVEESKSNKDVRKVASAVLEELGSGKSFFIPQSSSKLFTAMSEAQDDEDSILDALYPMNAFRSDLDPKPNDLLLHQYLLCSYFVYWERCSLLNASSAHADRVKAVLRFFNVSSAESLPTPLGELITQIRQDNLPHRSQESLSTFRRGDIVPDYPGVDAEITEVYRQMNTVMQKVSSAPMDALFPSVFFERIQPDEGRLKQYKILLIQELHSWSPADRLRVHLPESMILIQNDLQANYVMAHLNQVDPENDIFLRLPIRMSKLKPKESLDYVEEVLPELLTALNSKQMLPALVFNLDISNVERLASSLCEFLEEKESNFRSGNDFQIMLKRVEDMKKQLASQAKTNASKTRSKKANDDEDGKRLKGDNRVQVEEISDLDSMVQEIPPILPYFSFARQGAGESSQKIQELITDFLGDPAYHNEATRMYIRCINRGIGIHHTGMNSRVMSLMEHLFRTRNIGVLFCTESLALGIHSPCRTVVFAGDSAKLTNVQFRQISGRAGRRGIDFLGHVVLLGLSSRKITRLFTSQLQILRGHTVMDPTIHLQTKSQNESITSAVECQKNLKKRRGTKFTAQNVSDHLVESVRGGIERLHVSSFLWNTLNFSTKKHIPLQNETWKQYTTRFLENEGFALKPELEAVLRGYSKSEGTNVATEDGVVIPMYCRIQTELLVRALHAYMNVRLNGLNFTFMALLRDGTLHKLAEEYCATELSDLTSDAFHAMELRKNKDLMVLLSALFQVDAFGLPLEIHPSLVHASVHSRHLDEYAVQLPALDPNSSSAIERYTQRVLHHYAQFAREVMQFLRTTCPDSVYALPYTGYVVQRAVSSPGKYDTTFRLSGTRKDVLARSPFVALCGKGDTFTCVEDFLLSMASCFYLDASVVPTVDFIDLHSRKGAGRVHLNACTFDFLRIGSQQIRSQIQRIHLRDFHGLSFDDSWMILSRVCSAIDAIYASTSFFTSSKIESSTSQEYGTGVELLKQEDSLVVALKHLSCCWRLRRPELGLREDSWLLSIQRAKQDSKKKTN